MAQKTEKRTFRIILSEPGYIPRRGDGISLVPEIPAGNGYEAGGQIVEVDADKNIWTVSLKWKAEGGPMPSSGPGARYVVIVDVRNKVVAVSDLGACFWISPGKRLSIHQLTFNRI